MIGSFCFFFDKISFSVGARAEGVSSLDDFIWAVDDKHVSFVVILQELQRNIIFDLSFFTPCFVRFEQALPSIRMR